jgi:hypothetical protein
MQNAFDRFAKEFLEEVLAPVAAVRREYEVETPAQTIDVVVEPRAEVDHDKAFARLGWLARMTERACMVEAYSRTPGQAEVRGCIRKQLAWDNERSRKAEREKENAPEFPYLWIVSVGDPKRVTESYELKPRAGWPKGFRFATPGHAMGIVVLSELERLDETLLLRLLGRDAVLQEAIADGGRHESEELRGTIRELLVRRRMVMLESTDSEDRKEAAMLDQEFQQFKKAMRDEGRREGKAEGKVEGKAEGKAEGILRVLSVRKLAITDVERRRILTSTDLAQLDRWLERAVTAGSISEVLAD